MMSRPMADEDFILDTDENKPVVAPRELTGWEDVIFELADDDGESA